VSGVLSELIGTLFGEIFLPVTAATIIIGRQYAYQEQVLTEKEFTRWN